MNDINIYNILCPTDLSEYATSAFEESVGLARWFGAKVTVMPMRSDEMLGADPAEMRRFIDAAEQAGVPIEIVCLDEDACREVREAARQIGADLIAMGTNGRSGFKRLALGSVADGFIHQAPAPMVTVHRSVRGRKGLFRTMLCATNLTEASAGTIAVALSLADDGAKQRTVLHLLDTDGSRHKPVSSGRRLRRSGRP